METDDETQKPSKPHDYHKEAADLIASMGVTFEALLIGATCPMFCADTDKPQEMGKFPRRTHIHGEQWMVTFTKKMQDQTKTISFNFWDSYNDAKNRWCFKNPLDAQLKLRAHEVPWKVTDRYFASIGRAALAKKKAKLAPTAYDVIACLEKYEPGTFKEFASDMGLSDDSIRALEIYKAVQEEYTKIRNFFTKEELEKLQEIS